MKQDLALCQLDWRCTIAGSPLEVDSGRCQPVPVGLAVPVGLLGLASLASLLGLLGLAGLWVRRVRLRPYRLLDLEPPGRLAAPVARQRLGDPSRLSCPAAPGVPLAL